MGLGFVEKEIGEGGAGAAHGAAGDDEDLPSSLIVILDMDRWARRQDRGRVQGRGAARFGLQEVSGFASRCGLCGICSHQAPQSFSLHRDGTLDARKAVNVPVAQACVGQVCRGGRAKRAGRDGEPPGLHSGVLPPAWWQPGAFPFDLYSLSPLSLPLPPHPNVLTDGLPKSPMDYSRVVGSRKPFAVCCVGCVQGLVQAQQLYMHFS